MLRVSILLMSALISNFSLTAQPSHSEDPKALFLDAAQRNGLARKGMRPWHLKVSFTSYAEGGKEAERGTIEEFWEAPNRYKIIRTGTNVSQTDYGTEQGILRTGLQNSMPILYSEARDVFVNPIGARSANLPSSADVNLQMVRVGRSNLRCLTVGMKVSSDVEHELHGGPVCLDEGAPALRVLGTLTPNREFEFNDIEIFQNQYVAHTVQKVFGGKNEFQARIDVLEELTNISAAEFTPSPDATPVRKPVRISPSAAQALVIKRVYPEYPLAAKNQNVTGTVVVEILIDKSGHVSDDRVIGGPPALLDAAEKAVKQWTFKPSLDNGVPVEAVTSIGVNFH